MLESILGFLQVHAQTIELLYHFFGAIVFGAAAILIVLFLVCLVLAFIVLGFSEAINEYREDKRNKEKKKNFKRKQATFKG